MATEAEDLPFTRIDGGVRLRLHVTPNASRRMVKGLWHDADGSCRLKVAIEAPPDEGKANAAVIDFLSDELSVPRTSISVTSGGRQRRKTLVLAARGDDDLCQRLMRLCGLS